MRRFLPTATDSALAVPVGKALHCIWQGIQSVLAEVCTASVAPEDLIQWVASSKIKVAQDSLAIWGNIIVKKKSLCVESQLSDACLQGLGMLTWFNQCAVLLGGQGLPLEAVKELQRSQLQYFAPFASGGGKHH